MAEAKAEAMSHLMGQLKDIRLEDHQVSALVDHVSSFHDGALPMRIYTKGTPVPDTVIINTVLQPEQLDSIFTLLKLNTLVRKAELFPLGIVNPELFETRLELGR